METEVLTNEVIEELQEEVRGAFPSSAKVKVMIDEVADVNYFEVELDESSSQHEANAKLYGFEALVDAKAMSREDFRQWLTEREYNIGSFMNIQKYFESVDFSSIASRYEIDSSIVNKLESQLKQKVEVTLALTKVVDLMVEEAEFLINRCLDKAGEMSLVELASRSNIKLAFILDKAVYSPNKVGVYNFNDTTDVRRMMKAINQESVASQVLAQKQFIPIIKSLLDKLNRSDVLEVPRLIRIFDNTFYECITGQLEYLTAFLNETSGESAYFLKDGKYFIVSLGI